MNYCFHITIGDEVFKAIAEADSHDEAEATFIACLDSGDYDHFIQDRAYVCGDIQQLVSHRINTDDTFPTNRILPMEAQIIYYSNGMYPRTGNLKDIKTFLSLGGECESYKVDKNILERIAKRIYKKLYHEGFLPRVNDLSEDRLERFWQYFHALKQVDTDLIDIEIDSKMFDIVQRKAI